MDFSQLTEAFETHIGAQGQAEAAQLALWFNEAQLDLAYELGVVTRVELQAAAGEEYAPPTDCLRLLSCDIEHQRLPDGRLLFSRGGAGSLYYRRTPPDFSGVDAGQSSELPATAHHLLAQFAASRYWEAESEGDAAESNQAARWMGYYLQGKNAAVTGLTREDLGGWKVV